MKSDDVDNWGRMVCSLVEVKVFICYDKNV